MRITKQERDAVVTIVKNIFGSDVSVFLFGSRADDQKKGGDIDLYIKSSFKISDADKLSRKITMLTELNKNIGEQKVDIIINDGTDDKLIYKVAEQEGIKLC